MRSAEPCSPTGVTYPHPIAGNRLALIGLVAAAIALPEAKATQISLHGEKFFINNAVTNPGGQLEGLLPNSRMVQATFDDANPLTVGMWKYPTGMVYNAARQTNEFVAAVSSYRARGLLAVTVNLQGGNPVPGYAGATQPWDNTAFNADGSLKPAYLSRMDQVIRALDAQGMIAILGYFYFGQDERLTDETAVRNAVTNATQWVLDQGYTNVLIEIDNEADNALYTHAILRPARVSELISAVQSQSSNFGRRLNVAVSFTGGQVPPVDIMQTEDFILIHGNGQTPAGIISMVNTVRSYGLNKPIVFNEDSTSTANFQAAMNAHASWGYFDAGANNYVDGFQSPPTNWSINTPAKKSFFGLLQNLVRTTPPPRNRGSTITVHATPTTVNHGSDATFTISASMLNSSTVTTVRYSMSGTARLGTDYTLSGTPGQVDIPTGASSAPVILHSSGGAGTGNTTAAMILARDPAYRLAMPRKATVRITGH